MHQVRLIPPAAHIGRTLSHETLEEEPVKLRRGGEFTGPWVTSVTFGYSVRRSAGINRQSAAKEEFAHRQDYRAEEPYWIFECPAGGRWKIPAACVSGTIDAFIEDNRAVLMGEGRTGSSLP